MGSALAMLPGWARSWARARPLRLRSSEAVGYPRSHSASPERPEELGGFAHLLAELARPGVCSLDLRRAEALRHLVRRPERKEQPQLLAHPLGAWRQSPRELESLREVRNGLAVGRAQQCLGP